MEKQEKRREDRSNKAMSYRGPAENRPTGDDTEGLTLGRNAVRELLKTGADIEKIYVSSGERDGSISVLVATALEAKIPVVEVEKSKLDKMAGGVRHQGIIAVSSGVEYSTVDEILALADERGEKPLVILLDGVEDPHNLGAIIRNAECLGAHGIIIPKRRAVGVTATVARASAGAVSHVKIAKVTNIARTLETLKERGLWIYAADMDGESIYKTDMKGACALVLGSEGDGISRLTKEGCDFCVSIPLYGEVNSMNVSCASAVLLAEIARQRKG